MPNATAPTATENPLKVAMGWAMVVLLQWSWVTPWQPKRQGLSVTLTSGAHGWGPKIFLIDSYRFCILMHTLSRPEDAFFLYANASQISYIILIYIYMRVVLNSFIWKTSSSPKKKFLSPNFRELHVFLSRYMLAKILKKNVDVWYPQIVPGVWSLVTLHSAAAALKHLRSALRCWSLLTFIGQFRHNKTTV